MIVAGIAAGVAAVYGLAFALCRAAAAGDRQLVHLENAAARRLMTPPPPDAHGAGAGEHKHIA